MRKLVAHSPFLHYSPSASKKVVEVLLSLQAVASPASRDTVVGFVPPLVVESVYAVVQHMTAFLGRWRSAVIAIQTDYFGNILVRQGHRSVVGSRNIFATTEDISNHRMIWRNIGAHA